MGFRVTNADPAIEVNTAFIEEKVANVCKNNGITTDAQWSAFVAARFNATNASGLNAGTRTFLIEFFDKLVKIG